MESRTLVGLPLAARRVAQILGLAFCGAARALTLYVQYPDMVLRCLYLSLLAASFPSLSLGVVLASEPLEQVDPLDEGQTLFEQLDSGRTGIDFESRFENSQLWGSLWRQYFIGSIGSGIALGDVNGDRLPDVFFVGKDSPNALYLNRGDFRFEDVSSDAGLALPKGIGAGAAMVDIDNDGDLDIYVCYIGSPNQLFVNDGDGHFLERAEALGLAISTGSNAPSFCDYDRDGDLDLYLQCNYLEASENPAGMPDLLFENQDGVFVDVTERAGVHGLGQGHAAIWWDYDEDGWPDLYVANDFAPDDRLYRNNQDGTFTDVLKEAFPFAPYSAMGADLGDLNNDGHVDFLVAEMKPRDRAYYLKSVGPLSGKLFSIDKDGVSQYMQNAVMANVGPGQFYDVGYLTGMEATDWTWAPRLLDLDCDGLLDAFFTNGMARAFHDADLGVKVAKATSRRMQVALYARSPALEETNLAFRNLGGFRFEESGADWGLDLHGVSFAAGAADFDQDGDLDLVVGNWKGQASVYRNLSDGGDRLVIDLRGNDSNRFGLGAKVKARFGDDVQVRELTSMRGYMATDEPAVFFSFQEVAQVEELRIEWPSGAVQVVEGLETGRRYLIEEGEDSEVATDFRSLFTRSKIKLDKAAFVLERRKEVDRDQALLPFSEDRQGAPVLVHDWNEDGWPDLLLGGPAGQRVKLFQNVGGKRLDLVDTKAFNGTREAEVTDFTMFGSRLLMSSGGIEHQPESEVFLDWVFHHEGGFDFSPLGNTLNPQLLLSSGESLLWDCDDDGEIELIQAGGPIARRYPFAERNRVFNQDDWWFEAQGHGFAGFTALRSKVTDLELIDTSEQPNQSLVAATQFGSVHFWEPSWGRLVSDRNHLLGEANKTGYWSCVESGDFNGDGRVDLLIGNLGMNSRFGTEEGEVSELYFSKDPDASPRLFLEATVVDGMSYPTETRTLHQMYLPEEMFKTGSYENFGGMTMEEAFGGKVMAGLDKVVLEESRSLLLLQNAEGYFESTPLPYEAQSGLMIDAVAEDIDEDGDLDLVAILEPISPQPWVALAPNRGYMLVLRNDASSGFTPVLPWESGLQVARGQPKKLAFVDFNLDGRPELLVSVSDGPVMLFDLTR